MICYHSDLQLRTKSDKIDRERVCSAGLLLMRRESFIEDKLNLFFNFFKRGPSHIGERSFVLKS